MSSAPREERSEREECQARLFEAAIRVMVASDTYRFTRAHTSKDIEAVEHWSAKFAAERFPEEGAPAEEPEAAPAPPVEVRVGQVWRAEDGDWKIWEARTHVVLGEPTRTYFSMSKVGGGSIANDVQADYILERCTLVSDAPGSGEVPGE